MTVSILVVDDEPDVADLFRQRFRREAPTSCSWFPLACPLNSTHSPIDSGRDIRREVSAAYNTADTAVG